MINQRATNVRHVKYLELVPESGMYVESIIMKEDKLGNISFIERNKLDPIDSRRMIKILQNPNADRLELWDLMSQITLNNGCNALEYFHQLVRVISPNGQIYSPTTGVIGIPAQRITNTEQLTKEKVPVDQVIDVKPKK